MNAEPLNSRERDSLQFSLAALLLVMTIVAALFAKAGVGAILLLPLVLACGLFVAWGRLVENHGWGCAGLYLLRFAATGALPFGGAIAVAVAIWFFVFIASGYDDALTNSVVPRGAFPWLAIPSVLALAWFVSSRRWSYRGCWACSSVAVASLWPQTLAALTQPTASERALREAGFVYAFAAALFIAGYLGEWRRRRLLASGSRGGGWGSTGSGS